MSSSPRTPASSRGADRRATRRGGSSNVDRRLSNGLAVGVFLVWSATVLVGLVTADFQGAVIATPVMLAVAGYAFGTEMIDRVRGRT